MSDLRAEQIRILYQNLPFATGGAISVSAMLVAICWPYVDTAPLLTWAAVSVGAMVWRYLSYRRTCRHTDVRTTAFQPDQAQTLAHRTIWFSAFYGLVWAWLPLYYFPQNDPQLISNVGLIAVGMVSGALVTQSAFLPSLYAFLLPFTICSAATLTFATDNVSAMGYLALVYGAIAIVFGHRVNGVFLEIIRSRFANEELVTALRHEKRQADEASLAKSRFLASASHDVRQPLHAMSLYLGMLKDDPGNPVIVSRISETLATLEGLYDRILEVSRLDAGAVEVSRKPCNLSALCEACSAPYQQRFSGDAVRLRTAIEADVWVLSDQSLLTRILENLLSNALKYTHEGEVVVTLTRDGEHVTLAVTDTGIGMTGEQQARMFEEYYQADNAARDRTAGMGLGLSIVHRLCDLLALELSVASEYGVGSEFSLTLQAAEAPREAPSPAEAPISMEGACVVVIEDDPQVRTAMRLQLEHWGCLTHTYRDADSALADRVRADLIISDYRLPGGTSGIDVLERAADNLGAPVPGILVTGDTDPLVLKELSASGYAVLHKPVSAQLLKTHVSASLQSALAASP